jgi:SAM-dependent methyltransferase
MSYSLDFSRDAIMHIEDKRALYKNFYNTLKPGGQLLVTDYCWGNMVSRVTDNC